MRILEVFSSIYNKEIDAHFVSRFEHEDRLIKIEAGNSDEDTVCVEVECQDCTVITSLYVLNERNETVEMAFIG